MSRQLGGDTCQPANLDVVDSVVKDISSIQSTLREINAKLGRLSLQRCAEDCDSDVMTDFEMPAERDIIPTPKCGRAKQDASAQTGSSSEDDVLVLKDSEDNASVIVDSMEASSPRIMVEDLWVFHKIWADCEQEDLGKTTLSTPNASFLELCRSLPGTLRPRGERSTESLDLERKQKNAHCMFHPQSLTRASWDVVGALFVIYDTIMLPMLVFEFDQRPLKPIEISSAVFWVLDIIVSIRTGHIVGARVNMGPRSSALHYLKSWVFVMDLVLCIFEWLTTITALIPAGGANSTRALRGTRLLRFSKMLRLTKLKVKASSIQKQIVSTYTRIVTQLLFMFLIFGVVVHLLSCGWYAVCASNAGSLAHQNSSEVAEGNDVFDTIFLYAESARFILAQINGRTDQSSGRSFAEVLYICFCGCVSPMFMAYFISSLTSTFVDVQKAMDEAHPVFINRYLERHSGKVTWSLTYFVQKYMRNQRESQTDRDDEQKLFSVLPPFLAQELFYEVRSPRMVFHPLFRSMSENKPALLRHLCWAGVKPVFFPSMSMVFQKGDACDRMLFVDHGKLLYSKSDGLKDALHAARSELWDLRHPITGCNQDLSQKIAQLEGDSLLKGAWASEAALWIKWINKGNLLADKTSQVFDLGAKDFGDIVKQHYDAIAPLFHYAREFVDKLDPGNLTDLDVNDTQSCMTNRSLGSKGWA